MLFGGPLISLGTLVKLGYTNGVPVPQLNIFDGLHQHESSVELPDATLELRTNFLSTQQADWLFQNLFREVDWRQDTIRMFGKVHKVPRLQQWFADDGMTYTWSGIRMESQPWLPALARLRDKLVRETGHQFNTVLVNLYRDGSDTVGWHADDEPELGEQPVIASISLGAERAFQLRHQTRHDLATYTMSLPHGSLLLMSGDTQTHWKHCVPRRKSIKSPRINLTFRAVRLTRAEDILPGDTGLRYT